MLARPEGAAPFDSGDIYPGQTWSFTFTVPGQYAYFSQPDQDQGILGTIRVNG